VGANGVAILAMKCGRSAANVFNPDFVSRLHKALDRIDADPRVRALILTGGGRFFSNGLDTKWMGYLNKTRYLQLRQHSILPLPCPANIHWEAWGWSSQCIGEFPVTQNSRAFVSNWCPDHFWHSNIRVLGRLLTLGVPTIAAMNSHGIGGGFFLALVCDHRVMVDDGKAFLLLPELDLGMPLSPGFCAIAKCKLDKKALRTSVLTGKRWSAKDAVAANIVDRAVATGEQLMTASMDLAAGLAAKKKRTRHVYAMLKKEIYGECHATLTSYMAPFRMIGTLLALQLDKIRRGFGEKKMIKAKL
jgi:Delta3-Delta2-enoyl-CoA isomerase